MTLAKSLEFSKLLFLTHKTKIIIVPTFYARSDKIKSDDPYGEYSMFGMDDVM